MISKTQIDTAKYGKNATAITMYLNAIEQLLDSNITPYFKNAVDIFDKTFLGVKKEYSIDRFFDMFGGEFIELSPVFQRLTNSILKETGNYKYAEEYLVNTINNAVKHSITSGFFDKYIKDKKINTKNMFYGNNTTVSKYKALMRLANKNESLSDLLDNVFMNMLTPNSTDTATALKTGKPQLFNASVMKNKDADSVNQYVAGFRDLLTHSEEIVRDFGNEMIIYAYLTSGGVSGGLNNIMNLVPFDILANLTSNDDVTYNDYVRSVINQFSENLPDSEIERYKDLVYRSLWYNSDIVPEVGISSLLSNGFTRVDDSSNYVLLSQNNYKNSGLKASPHIVMSENFTTTYYNGTDIIGNHQFTPFISITNNINKSEKVLYRYVGYISNVDGTKINAVYQLENKLGYRDKQYQIKDISDNSFIPENNKYNTGNNSVRFNPKLLDNFAKGSYYQEVTTKFVNKSTSDIENSNDDVTDTNVENAISPQVSGVNTTNDTEIVTDETNSEPLSIQILDNSESIIVEFPNESKDIINSFELQILNAFNSQNNYEQLTLANVTNYIESRNNVMSAIPILPTTLDEDSKPITIVRNESFIDQPISNTLKSEINRINGYDATFNVLSSDKILIDYLTENDMKFNILGESTISENIENDSLNNVTNTNIQSGLNFSELFPQLNQTINDADNKKINIWKNFVLNNFGNIVSYELINNEYSDLSKSDRNEYETSTGNIGVNRFGGEQNVLVTFENGIIYNLGDGIGKIMNSPKTLSLKVIEDSGKFAFFTGTGILLKEKMNTQSTLEDIERSSNNYSNIIFTQSSSIGYRQRTIENAQSADMTIAFAVDFNTAGERLTKNATEQAGKLYQPIDISNISTNFSTSSSTADITVNNIVSGLNTVNAKSINIAGNGIYTFVTRGLTQEQIDTLVYEMLNRIVNNPNLKNRIEKIITGGQTGIDEAGAKAGARLGIYTEVHAPKDWVYRTVDGIDHKGKDAEEGFKSRFGNQSNINTQYEIPFDNREFTLQDKKDQMIQYIKDFPQAGIQAQITIQDINNASNLDDITDLYQKLCKS